MAELPIGYWVKRVDELITVHLAEALAVHRLDRFRWQLLNTLSRDGAAAPDALAARLSAFVAADDVRTMVDDLAARGWVVADADGLLSLTAAGAAAHRDVLVDVDATRRRSTEGIDGQEYATAVATLRRIAANLGHREPGA